MVNFNETANLNLKSHLYLLGKDTLKNASSNITPTLEQKRNGRNAIDGFIKKEEGVAHLVTADIMNEPIQVSSIEEIFKIKRRCNFKFCLNQS